MTPVEPVGHTVDLILADDLGEVDVGVVDGDAEVEHHVHTSPVAESDGHTIGVLRVEALDVFLVFHDVRTELLLVGLIHIGHGVEGGLHVAGEAQFEGVPDLCGEVVEVLLFLRGAVEHEVGGHIAKLLTVLTAALQQLQTLLVGFGSLLTGIGDVHLFGTVEPGEFIFAGGIMLGDEFGGLLHEPLRLGEGALGQLVVVPLEGMAGGGKHRGGTEVELRTAGGEGPHVVRRTAALAVGTHLIGLQRRVVVQAVGDRGSIAQMVIVVEDGVGERRGHVPDLLCLCHEVERAVLNELQDVGHAVGAVQVDIALLLRDEGLVALGTEELPGADEVLHDIDVGARLDVEVTGIEEAADVQAGDEFQRLVFRVGGRSLTVQVEVVALRGLQISLLEGLAVPRAITLGDVHVVHVDGHPHVGGSIGDLVVDVGIDEEVVGLRLAILDEVDAGGLDAAEVELHIIIFKVGSPRRDGTLKGLRGRTVGIDAHELGRSLRRVELVEFDDGHLRLFRRVAYLRETDIRLTDPARNGIRLDSPGDDLASLALRQYAADDEPAVLCEHSAIEEFQL